MRLPGGIIQLSKKNKSEIRFMALVCVHPSASFRTKLAAIAAAEGLPFLVAVDSRQALELLASHEAVELLVMASDGGGEADTAADSNSDPAVAAAGDISSGSEDTGEAAGLRFIEEVRLLSHRATLPVACVLQNRDLSAARQAFRAGATEVFEIADEVGLRGFVREIIREAARGRSVTALTGRVLVLEDSPSHGAFVAHICKELGLRVDLATTVEEGLALFATKRYQMAVIDIVLEGVQSGLALVREIRRQPAIRGRLPVVVMSGFADVSRRIEALRCGASDFLHKPFAAEEFVWRVRRLLQDQALDDSTDIASEPAGASESKWRRLGLTAREAQVCDALLGGGGDKAIAEDLGISFWTVRTHIQRVFTKLGVLNRRELMVRYLTSRDTPQ
jgi:DNA-binding NarL/FixJ family response regulator